MEAMKQLDEYKADFASKPIAGTTAIGLMNFSAPLYSQMTDNLWMGGTPATYWDDAALPPIFKAVLNLYPWERYKKDKGTTYREVQMYDSIDGAPDMYQIMELAEWVHQQQKEKVTLVHCQAGLNRSGLVTGAALFLMGFTGDDAVEMMREKRSPAVLVNPTFEKIVRGLR